VVAENKRGRRRRRRWLIALGIVVIILAWGGLLAAKSISAYHHDQQGLDSLEQVKSNLTPDSVTTSSSVKLLDRAQAEFASAQSDLSSPLFAPITIVPVIGRQFRAVQDLSTAAGTVCQVGSTFLSQVHDELNQPHGAGPERVASLRRLAAISASAVTQLSTVNTGPSQALIGPLVSKHNEFVDQLANAQDRLVKAAGVSAAVATILQGPQNYVVLAGNNAEMRAGYGTWLDVGTATTSNGSIQLGDLGPSGEKSLPQGAVPVPAQFQRNWGYLYPTLDMRNLGLTPQFDVTAPLANQMWNKVTGQTMSGVIAIDIAGVQQLLTVTGPVVVNGQTISSDNVEQYLLHEQYVGLSDNPANSDEREDALGGLAGAVLQQLQGQSTDLNSLAKAVSGAVSGRHLLMWSKDPTAQRAWEVSGVSGSLTYHSVDISLINLDSNKLDPYVPIHVAVTTAPSGADTAVTMTVKLTNTTPDGQGQFIGGPYPGSPIPYGGYGGVIAANIPGAARHLSITGTSQVAVSGVEGPTWVLGGNLVVLQGQSATVVFHFTMPGKHGSMTVVPSARIPAEQWTSGGKTFDDTAPTSVSW
jgi:Protein of unknown function (DUF4012)